MLKKSEVQDAKRRWQKCRQGGPGRSRHRGAGHDEWMDLKTTIWFSRLRFTVPGGLEDRDPGKLTERLRICCRTPARTI